MSLWKENRQGTWPSRHMLGVCNAHTASLEVAPPVSGVTGWPALSTGEFLASQALVLGGQSPHPAHHQGRRREEGSSSSSRVGQLQKLSGRLVFSPPLIKCSVIYLGSYRLHDINELVYTDLTHWS